MTTPPAPNFADLIFHRLSEEAAHADVGCTIGVALHLEGPVPKPSKLRADVAARLGALPCLTHTLSGRPPKWAPAYPDLERHIGEHRLPEDPGALEEAIQELLREPLPADAPPWRLMVLHGHVPGASVLLYLTHHAVQDGGSVVAVLETLFGPPLLPSQHSTTARMPRIRVRQAYRSIAPIIRSARPHGFWDSESHPLSTGRRLMWAEVPVASLRAAARLGKCSANDAYLTALAHAIAGWAAEHWPGAADAPLPVIVPVNLRTPEEAVLPGNRCFAVRVDLPGGPSPLAERLDGVVQATTLLKSVSHRAVLHKITDLVPTWLMRRIGLRGLRPGCLSIGCSFLFLRHRLEYGGARAVRVAPVMFCPEGTPLTVSLAWYGQLATVCFRIDAALPGGDTIPARWRRAVEELSTPVGEAV
ncbi:wax ester/triacylglycerol synthase domain-containing protein [Streptomyces jumonjinensis]|uniref:wax ester/triacylglycerol synthase domain-containing protein n=1 Tax=Streptomyces jumonjinensis TaxID=1945 RepID=UPI0037978F30